MTPIWAKEMLGTGVRTPDGEVLGETKDFVFDPTLTHVQCVLISSSNFLGLGGKLIPAPLQSLLLDTENECFIMDVGKQPLNKAQKFDKDADARTDDPNLSDNFKTRHG
jgi:sporulation protein YlmC with PRC-barrel domain